MVILREMEHALLCSQNLKCTYCSLYKGKVDITYQLDTFEICHQVDIDRSYISYLNE